MNPNSGQPYPGAIPPPSSDGTQVAGKVFYGQPGTTFIYSDGQVHIFTPGPNLITDSVKIAQMTGAADKSSGRIHTREEVPEVVARPDKIAEARNAIINDPNNQAAAKADPRIAALLEKAKQQAAARPEVPPLGATTTADLVAAAAASNSGVTGGNK